MTKKELLEKLERVGDNVEILFGNPIGGYNYCASNIYVNDNETEPQLLITNEVCNPEVLDGWELL